MQTRYARDGHGLWLIETHSGEFIGDCGITWQSCNDTPVRTVMGMTVTPSISLRRPEAAPLAP